MPGLYGLKKNLRISLYSLVTPKFLLSMFGNSDDQDEMPQNAAFYLGLHCLRDESNLQRKNYSFYWKL